MRLKAALYLRSSKDQKDVSLDFQRRELERLADARGLTITAEYSDVVESGKDEQRPGYQSLCAAIGNPLRPWDHLLIYDTSRLARRQHIAVAFSHHCQKKGVKIIYSKIPEMDPVTEMLVLSVMRAMDEMHSHASREKGLGGMAENVRKGFRAGGRAPIGYELDPQDTGLIRDGKPVTKSVLKLGPQAPAVARYLKARAVGTPRPMALRNSGLQISSSSCVGVEWNVLTYAGCTVWNVNREVGHPEGRKRPRSEWVITENTHPAIITRDEAETIMAGLENSDMGKRISEAKRGMSSYLMSGLLYAPDGRQWNGMRDRRGPSYRLPGVNGQRGRVIRAEEVDQVVLGQLAESLQSSDFVDALYQSSQQATIDVSRREGLQRDLAMLNGRISRAVDAVISLEDPAPMYRKINELERQRRALIGDIEQQRQEDEIQLAGKQLSRERIRDLLDDFSEQLAVSPTERVKPLLESFLERVTLSPANLEMQLHFRIRANDCVNVASPQGFEPRFPP